MCNGERVRKLCTVTHRGTTNVIVPGVTNTICGTCQCIINFFFSSSISLPHTHTHTHTHTLSLQVCVSVHTHPKHISAAWPTHYRTRSLFDNNFFHANRTVLFLLLYFPSNLSGRTPFPREDHRDY